MALMTAVTTMSSRNVKPDSPEQWLGRWGQTGGVGWGLVFNSHSPRKVGGLSCEAGGPR